MTSRNKTDRKTETKKDGQKNGLMCGTICGLMCGMAEKEIKEYKETEKRGKKNHPDGLAVLLTAAVRFNNYDWVESSFVHQNHEKRTIWGCYRIKKQRKAKKLTDNGKNLCAFK